MLKCRHAISTSELLANCGKRTGSSHLKSTRAWWLTPEVKCPISARCISTKKMSFPPVEEMQSAHRKRWWASQQELAFFPLPCQSVYHFGNPLLSAYHELHDCCTPVWDMNRAKILSFPRFFNNGFENRQLTPRRAALFGSITPLKCPF